MKIASLIIVLLSLRYISALGNGTSTTDYNLFISSDDPIKLDVSDVSKTSAKLSWDLPMEKREKLKAMRLNCTRLKSLVEPFIVEPEQHSLFNPSLSHSNITVDDLISASKYTCSLIGAVSLDLGREKLTILSEPVEFSTLLEKPDRKLKPVYGFGTVKIIIGGALPIVIVIIGIILILIGYRKYQRIQNNRGILKTTKYRMSLPTIPFLGRRDDKDKGRGQGSRPSYMSGQNPTTDSESDRRSGRSNESGDSGSRGISKGQSGSTRAYVFHGVADYGDEYPFRDHRQHVTPDPNVLYKPVPIYGHHSPIRTKSIGSRTLSSSNIPLQQSRPHGYTSYGRKGHSSKILDQLLLHK